MKAVYTLSAPTDPLPLVFDSPHSGRDYPPDFRFSCPFDALRRAEDNHVDTLFSSVPERGGSLLCALFPRTYIDVNRAVDDIDPDLLAEPWPHTLNPTARAHAGIGLIRRILRPGLPVYDRRLAPADIRHRIDAYYAPYHAQLETLIAQAHGRYGRVWHINCHSMPRSGGFSRLGAVGPAPDFVLGDRDGTSCAPAFTAAVRDVLRGLGYRVAINTPYRGVELVRRYSAPAAGRHSLQIEINKGLYWDDDRHAPSRDYAALKADIDILVRFCAQMAAEGLEALAAD